MTTGLLGDTPFLDLLQDYTVKFNNRVESNPFGNYSNFQASDFVNTPFGQPIAQNTFQGNQFQMPNLSSSTLVLHQVQDLTLVILDHTLQVRLINSFKHQ